MTETLWHNPGEKKYYSGVDRGIVQPHAVARAVPWNGLTSFEKQTVDGELEPVYINGQVQAFDVSPGRLKAVLSALYYPDEFGEHCLGEQALLDGAITAYHQPKGMFDLSYRETIGDDLRGPNGQYKIVIIKNAYASESNRNIDTIGDSVTPAEFSWDVEAIPERQISHYDLDNEEETIPLPTAIITINSEKLPRGLLNLVEEILYNPEEPRIPSLEELWGIISAPMPTVLKNWATNPSFETTNEQMIEVCRNRWRKSRPSISDFEYREGLYSEITSINDSGTLIPSGMSTEYIYEASNKAWIETKPQPVDSGIRGLPLSVTVSGRQNSYNVSLMYTVTGSTTWHTVPLVISQPQIFHENIIREVITRNISRDLNSSVNAIKFRVEETGTFPSANGTPTAISLSEVSVGLPSWVGYATGEYIGNTDLTSLWSGTANNSDTVVYGYRPNIVDSMDSYTAQGAIQIGYWSRSGAYATRIYSYNPTGRTSTNAPAGFKFTNNAFEGKFVGMSFYLYNEFEISGYAPEAVIMVGLTEITNIPLPRSQGSHWITLIREHEVEYSGNDTDIWFGVRLGSNVNNIHFGNSIVIDDMSILASDTLVNLEQQLLFLKTIGGYVDGDLDDGRDGHGQWVGEPHASTSFYNSWEIEPLIYTEE